MPRTVTCRIIDEADGRFSVVAELPPDRRYHRDGLSSLAEAEEWIEGLRVLMTACGAPVIRRESRVLDPEHQPAGADAAEDGRG